MEPDGLDTFKLNGMERSRLEYLFNAYFHQTATAEEKQELMTLLLQKENDAQLQALVQEAWQQLPTQEPFFSDAAGEAMLAAITAAPGKQRLMGFIQRHRLTLRVAAAAAVLLGIAIAAWLWLRPARPANNTMVAQTHLPQPVNDIAPGGNKAILTLADGSAITLDDSVTGVLAKQGGTQVIRLNNGPLAYNKTTENTGSQVLYNTLATPRGGQYQLVLPDGTKVWMNASSSLRFPTAFNSHERVIELSGEAYFEVAPDATKPFRVAVAAAGGNNPFNVEVLGTHFNVMAYGEENNFNATLLEGAVRISHGGSFNKLLPGQQARIDKNNEVKILQPDMDEVMAWKNGDFLFNSYDVEKIMHQLSRWYDVDIVYEGKIPGGHFSGIVSRNNNISQVLKILEAGGMHFSIEGKKLIVKS